MLSARTAICQHVLGCPLFRRYDELYFVCFARKINAGKFGEAIRRWMKGKKDVSRSAALFDQRSLRSLSSCRELTCCFIA